LPFTYQDNSSTASLPASCLKTLCCTPQGACQTFPAPQPGADRRPGTFPPHRYKTSAEQIKLALPRSFLPPKTEVHLKVVLQMLRSPSDNNKKKHLCQRAWNQRMNRRLQRPLRRVFTMRHLFYPPPDPHLAASARRRSTSGWSANAIKRKKQKSPAEAQNTNSLSAIHELSKMQFSNHLKLPVLKSNYAEHSWKYLPWTSSSAFKDNCLPSATCTNTKVCFRKETEIFTVFQNKPHHGLLISMQIMLTPY